MNNVARTAGTSIRYKQTVPNWEDEEEVPVIISKGCSFDLENFSGQYNVCSACNERSI